MWWRLLPVSSRTARLDDPSVQRAGVLVGAHIAQRGLHEQRPRHQPLLAVPPLPSPPHAMLRHGRDADGRRRLLPRPDVLLLLAPHLGGGEERGLLLRRTSTGGTRRGQRLRGWVSYAHVVRRGLWCAGASLAAVYMPFFMPMGSRRVCHMNSMKMAGSPQARGQLARNGHFPQVRMRYGKPVRAREGCGQSAPLSRK